MKKFFAILGGLALTVSLLGCQQRAPDLPAISRSFLAGYQDSQGTGRVLLNLLDDGTAAFYVGRLEDGTHTMTQYTAAYTLGENEEFDETITINHQQGPTDGVILDGVFELSGEETQHSLRFYETAPVSMDGDVYVGYLTKTSGMGPLVYAYGLCLREDASFDVSIMQMASVMHVWGSTGGTCIAKGNTATFTYDIRTDQGELIAPDALAEAVDFNGHSFSTGFNIQQNTMSASDARFIQVKETGE